MSDTTPVNPKFFHYILILPFFLFVRIWHSTLRFVADERSVEILSSGRRMIGLAWHNRIFFLPMAKRVYRKKFPMTGLVSASRDGSYLSAFFRFCGIRTVRGSSRKRAVVALKVLIDAVENSDVFITPDGPLGPKYKAKPGFLAVAKESGQRIVLLCIFPRSYWQVKSWDSFMLPKPFSKVDMKSVEFENYDKLISMAGDAGIAPEDYVGNVLVNGEFIA